MSGRYRYEDLAGFITALVSNGVLEPGSRVPSLREISRQRRVSISTALQAYRLLEDRRVLEARPQSGYYVARGVAPPTQALVATSRVGLESIARPGVSRLLEFAADPRLVPLGCAVPSPRLLAGARLDRFLTRAARTAGSQHNCYTVPKGDSRLRRELARRALRWSQALSPEDIVITTGCTEALSLAVGAVAKAGDTVVVESPTCFAILEMLKALGIQVLELPADSCAGPNLDALARALATHSVKACLFTSSFNNPQGYTLSNTRKSSVLRLLAAHAVPLIEDDVYGDIHFENERPVPFAAFDTSGNTLYCSSFSKTVAPGYRIGWLATRRYMPQVLERKLALTLSGPALPQAAFADFLSCGGYDHHVRRLRRAFESTVSNALRTIETHFPHGTRVTYPRGGFLLWLQLPAPLVSCELLDRALTRGICFAPGDIFSASGGYRNCLRLSCGSSWEPRLEQGLITLGQLASDAIDGP